MCFRMQSFRNTRITCAVWVDSSKPMNPAADTGRFLEALKALELVVVVDVAFTETAAQAHYVLPASSQYEKCEFTLFNFEAPVNYFHVRAPVLAPLAGTLSEPVIYTRLARELGLLPDVQAMSRLAAAATDLPSFARVFSELMAALPSAATIAPIVLFNTLGPHLPGGTAAAAPLWAARARLAKTETEAVRLPLDGSRRQNPGTKDSGGCFSKIAAHTIHPIPSPAIDGSCRSPPMMKSEQRPFNARARPCTCDGFTYQRDAQRNCVPEPVPNGVPCILCDFCSATRPRRSAMGARFSGECVGRVRADLRRTAVCHHPGATHPTIRVAAR